MSLLSKLEPIWTRCREFVQVATAGRDPSHGYPHMEEVCQKAVLIASLLGVNDETMKSVVIVAMLHDVNDHKYDKDGTLTEIVTKFVNGICPGEEGEMVLKTILAISFSKEKRRGKKWFVDVLGTRWTTIRTGCLI